MSNQKGATVSSGTRRGLKPDAIAAALNEPLTDEEGMLESLVVALARGQTLPELWEQLHGAAIRDNRVSELAFAYEKMIQERRFKVLPGAKRADVFIHAADFLAGAFGDIPGAVSYAERGFECAPLEDGAFAKLKGFLLGSEDAPRLAKAYALAASKREAEERYQLLSEGIATVSQMPSREDPTLPLYEALLKADPDNLEARQALKQRYLEAGKLSEAASLFESELAREPGPSAEEAHELRGYLVSIYMDSLSQPAKALPHVEALLGQEPEHAAARSAAETLLEHRPSAARAAQALGGAHLALDQPQDAAAMLTLELRLAGTQRRPEVQRQLALLKMDRLEDPQGARELLEPLVSRDASDDDLRRRYVALSSSLDRQLDAAKLLSRTVQTTKDDGVKTRVAQEVGSLFLQAGDVRRAQAAFQVALDTAADPEAQLVAARELAGLLAQAHDLKGLAVALEQAVRLEPDKELRFAHAERLARLCDGELEDTKRAQLAWTALVDSPLGAQALARLGDIHEAAGDRAGLIWVLEKSAERAGSTDEARDLEVRAAMLRSQSGSDRTAALERWQSILDRYGPSSEVHGQMLPLLEQEHRWADLARVLEKELELKEGSEGAEVLGRLGQLRASRLEDVPGALDAFRQALELDAGEATSRVAVERLLRGGDYQLQAADILEPVYREEKNAQGVLRVLQARAELAPETAARLEALAEAHTLAAGELEDSTAALDLAGQALKTALAGHRELVPQWLQRVEETAERTGDVARLAEVLSEALADRSIDDAELMQLAVATGEAQAGSGDAARAVATMRRALAFQPDNPELMQRIDQLLMEQGTPEQRLAFYREALDQPSTPERRRGLLHSMAQLQKRDLGDVRAAIGTWQRLLAEVPGDLAAHDALVQSYREVGDLGAVYQELARALPTLDPARRRQALTEMARVSTDLGDVPRALEHYGELLEAEALEGPSLDAAEQLAVGAGDWRTVHRVLEQRLKGTSEPTEQATYLDRLGEVEADRLATPEEAVVTWKRAARLYEGAAEDPARARTLYERVLGLNAGDDEAAERLLELYVSAREWEPVPGVYRVIVATCEDAATPLDRVLGLEAAALEAQAVTPFLALTDVLLDRFPLAELARAEELLAARVRVLQSDAERVDQVAAEYRRLVESHDPDAEHARTFERFLSEQEDGDKRRDDRRWLFERQVQRSAEPATVLTRWAQVEEQDWDNPDGALQLYSRVLEIDGEALDALGQVARLKAARGDLEEARGLLERLEALAEGERRTQVELHLAGLLLEGLGQSEEALGKLERVLAEDPTDAEALRLLNTALSRDESRAGAAALLERASEFEGEPEKRAAILETLLEISAGTAELKENRCEWFKRLIDLKAGDPEGALEMALLGSQEAPDDEELWDAAERLARELDRPNPVREAYVQALDKAQSEESAEAVGRRLVDFHEEWFEEGDEVVELLVQVWERAPSAFWALDRLKLAFNAAGRWEDLFRLYDRAIERSQDKLEREDLLDEAALAAKDFAGDADRAIDYLERLAELRPKDARLEASLERLYEREGRTRPLIDLLSSQLERLDGNQLEAQRLRVAALWLDLKEPKAAFELIEKVLDANSDATEGYELLECILTLPVPAVSLPPAGEGRRHRRAMTVRDHAAVRLKQRYEGEGRLEDVVRMLEVELEAATEPSERVAHLQDIMNLRLERLDDVSGAFDSACHLVRLAPDNAEHRAQLAELAGRVEAQDRRAQLLVEVARDSGDEGLLRGLLREAAEVHEGPLEQPGAAIDLYLEVLALATGDAENALFAARRLDELLATADRPAERCDVLERLATLETGEARSVALGAAAGLAADRLGDPERAIRAWRARLEDDEEGSDRDALDGLVDCLERAGRHRDLVEALEQRATQRVNDEGSSARADRERVARLHGEQLEDRGRAIEVWREIREQLGADLVSFEALAELLQAESRWEELAELLQSEAKGAEAERAGVLFRRLGDLHRDRTGDVNRAVEAYVGAHDWEAASAIARSVAEPAQAKAICGRLLDLAVKAWTQNDEQVAGQAAEWSIEALKNRLLDEGDHAAVVALLERGAALPFPRGKARDMQREAACLTSDQLRDSEGAVRIFQGLFEEDPADEAAAQSVTRFAVLLEELGRHEDIVALWEKQAQTRERQGNLAQAAALWARAAMLAEQQLKDRERTLADHRRGAALGGEESLEALARIHTAAGESQRTAETLEWLCAQSSREVLGERALRLAEAYDDAGHRDLARARLEWAAGLAIDGAPVRQRLAELYRADESWDRLADLLAAEAGRAGERRKKRKLLEEAGRLHLERRDEPGAAVPLFEQAVELEPDDIPLRLLLTESLGAAGDHQRAAELLQEQLERYGSRKPKARALVHQHLAGSLLALEQPDQALTELETAAKIDPAHPGILEALAKLAFQLDKLERAERTYRALLLVLRRAPDGAGASRAEAFLHLSEIAVRRDDPVRSTEFVESAFECALESEHEREALERALRARGRHELLARAIEARLERSQGAVDTAKALGDLVVLYEEQPAAGEAAKERIQRKADATVAELEKSGSQDDGAWLALARVSGWLGDSSAEARVLERLVATFEPGPNASAEPLYRLAELRIDDTERAADAMALLERAIEVQPDLDRVEKLLRQQLTEPPRPPALVQLMERICREPGREASLVDALLWSAELPGSTPEAVREAVSASLQQERAQDAERLLESVIARDREVAFVGEDGAWVRLELARLRRAAERAEAALDLEEAAAEFLAPDEARPILLTVAKARAEAEELERAAGIYKQLLEREPADREAWQPLMELLRRLGQMDALAQLIESTTPLVDAVEDRSQLRLERANILLEQPEQRDEAVNLLREVMLEDPTQTRAGELLAEVLGKLGRHDELVEVLTTQLEAAKDQENVEHVVRLSLELGQLLEKLERPEDAFDVYSNVQDWDSKSQGALRAVTRLLAGGEDRFAYADALERQLAVEEPEQVADLVAQLVAVRNELDDAEGAERALDIAFAANPADRELCDKLCARYQEREAWDKVAETLARAFEGSPDDVSLLKRLVDAHTQAGQLESAADALAAAVALQPEDGELYQKRAQILERLDRVGDSIRDWERAVELNQEYIGELARALGQATDVAEPEERKRLVRRLVEVNEARGATDEARVALERLLVEDPEDLDVLLKLARVEGNSGDPAMAAGHYHRLVELTTGQDLVMVSLELLEVCRKGDNVADARYALERCVEQDPGDMELRQHLRSLYATIGANRELAHMLLGEAMVHEDVETRYRGLVQAGELLAGPGGDLNEAMGVLEQARSLIPDDLDGIVALARAYAVSGRSYDALNLLNEGIASQRNRRSKPLGKVYRELARLQLESGQQYEALESLNRAFEMDPKNGGLAMELGQLALELDEEPMANRAFRAVTMMKPVPAGSDEGATTDARATAYFQMGRLAMGRGDPRRAKVFVAKALNENPGHEHARALADEIARQGG